MISALPAAAADSSFDWSRLSELRTFEGPENQFWLSFTEAVSNLAGSRWGCVLRVQNGACQLMCFWPLGGQFQQGAPKQRYLDRICQEAFRAGQAVVQRRSASGAAVTETILGVRLHGGTDSPPRVAVCGVSGGDPDNHEAMLARLTLAADIPESYAVWRRLKELESEAERLYEPLDLMLCLDGQRRFVAAGMALCNEVAGRYQCSRVSLGWLKGGYVRIKAVSQMEQFDRKADAVQSMEAAMEECLDQDEEVLWPAPEQSTSVCRAHQQFAGTFGSSYLASLPLRRDDHAVGALLCERSKPFSPADIRGLRLICDQTAGKLSDLNRRDRWLGAKMAGGLRRALAWLFGFEHTWAKAAGVVAAASVALLLFGKMDYRVEAPFTLRTHDLAFLTAPYDGYIENVHEKAGSVVATDQKLLDLDRSELELKATRALADLHRYMREEEKARAESALADMRVAQALKEQAQARLELNRYHLSRAQIRAPFAGVVVEGELEKLLGAPVRKGDVLFKVARLEDLYVEMRVLERDVHEIRAGDQGTIAFISRPDLKFPVLVNQISPLAVVREEGNVFPVRARLADNRLSWWRPGMSGLAKIEVGSRRIGWILLHHTVDYLRMKLWW